MAAVIGVARCAFGVLGEAIVRWRPAAVLGRAFAEADAARDAVLESSFPVLGDDSFELPEAGVDLGDPVLMFPGAVVDDDDVKCASADSAAGVGPAAVFPRPPSGQPTVPLSEVDPRLLWLLRRAGDEWGPRGVAEVAAQLAKP